MADGTQFTPQEFASKIKAKYPAYASIPDDQLVEKITAKYPQYKEQIKQASPESQRPDAVKQAQGKFANLPPNYDISKGPLVGTPEQDKTIDELVPKVPQRLSEIRRNVAEIGGSMVGGEAVAPLIKSAEAAGGASAFLKWLLPMITRAGGTGAGAGAGALATGASPKEAISTAGQFAAMEAGTETAFSGVSKVKGSKFVKDLTKSKVTEMQEAHTAEAAKIEADHQKDLAAHQERVGKVDAANKERAADHQERLRRIDERYQKRVTEHQVKTEQLDLDHQKQIAEYNEKVKQVKADYAKKLQEYQGVVGKEKGTAAEASSQESAAQAKKGLALKHQNDLAGLVKENLELTNKQVSKELGQEFNAIQDAVQAKNPRVKVTDAEREARGQLYFPDSVSAFNKVMENVSGKLKSTDYSILRKAYSNLNDMLYGGGELPGDLYKAVKVVRDQLGKDLQGAADSVGLGGKYRSTMQKWSDYKDIWSDKSSIAKGGSPIRRILDAEDPAFVVDQLKGKAGDRLLEDIGKYSKYGADKALAGKLRGFIEQVKGMPGSTSGVPEAPARPSFPKPPEKSAAPKAPEKPYAPKSPKQVEHSKPPEKQELAPFDRDAAARKILIDRIR